MNWKEYSKTLPLAYKIIDSINYPDGIKTSQDFADRINDAGMVNRILIKGKSSNQMKIWENFKEHKPFLSSIKKLPNCVCKDCLICEMPFAEIKTEFVHMTNDKEGRARYICDDCLKRYKNTK